MFLCGSPPKKIYLAKQDNGLYCDVKEACIYKKKQRRGGCQSWRTLIRPFLSFPIHALYQWHSSSSACVCVCDRDQIDFPVIVTAFYRCGNVRRKKSEWPCKVRLNIPALSPCVCT